MKVIYDHSTEKLWIENIFTCTKFITLYTSNKKEFYLDSSPQQILYYIPLMFLLAVYFQSHSPTDKRIMNAIFHIC